MAAEALLSFYSEFCDLVCLNHLLTKFLFFHTASRLLYKESPTCPLAASITYRSVCSERDTFNTRVPIKKTNIFLTPHYPQLSARRCTWLSVYCVVPVSFILAIDFMLLLLSGSHERVSLTEHAQYLEVRGVRHRHRHRHTEAVRTPRLMVLIRAMSYMLCRQGH